MAKTSQKRGTGERTEPAPVSPPSSSPIASPLLRNAAERVAERYSSVTLRPEQLEEIARCVEADDGQALRELVEIDAVTCREYLHLLRQEVLKGGHLQDSGSVAEVFALAHGFEQTQSWIDTHARNEDRLSPPRNMNLAVEVVHDLKSPLTSILFLAQTLRNGDSGKINDLQRRQLGLIHAAALSVVSMAGNLIEYANGEDGYHEPSPTPFSIRGLIDAICDMERPLAEEKKLALRVILPSVDYRKGFPAPLSRVVLNLLHNALQNTDSGYIEIMVQDVGVSTVEFSVRDTGPGIRDESRRGLFEPFKKKPRGDRYGFSGTGLGLAICVRLVKSMNSELHYESSPGWGTRFHFTLELPPASV